MKSFIRLFTNHPASIGESYGGHLLYALGFSLRMLCGGLACLVHALLPFAFKDTGSDQIRLLHDRMVVNRRRLDCASRPPLPQRPE